MKKDKKEMNCVYEEFTNIDTLLKTLEKRPNNKIMTNEKSSQTGSYSFTKTSNYNESVSLLVNGYTEVLEDIKTEVRKNNKTIYEAPIERRKIMNMPIGFIPNVPNALQNKPDSMINIISTPQKRKTLSIIYAMSGSCGEEAETFVKAGAALVSAINLVELHGIQTRLYVDFMPSRSGKELITPILKLKNYGERFNLTKICFPLVHPSMFRRIGFKYLETCPFMTEEDFAFGYGSVPDLEELREWIPTDSQTFLLNTRFIKEHDYNIHDILKELKIEE